MTPLDKVDPKIAAEKVLEVGRSQAAKHFGVNESTFRDYLYRNNLPTKKASTGESKPGISIKDGSTAEVTSEASTDVSDPEKLIRERGLDPADWEFSGMTVNEWDAFNGETMRQLKVQVKRKNPIDFIEPARVDGPRIKNRNKAKTSEGTVLVIGDSHAPFHDPYMNEGILALIADLKPERAIHIGDLVDFPEISRHRHNPAWKAATQLCIDAGYDLLADYIAASPGTDWTLINGNHEDRLRNTVIDLVEEIYGLGPAKTGKSSLSLEHLLRLDELEVTHQADDNTYEYTKVKINENLGAVHGHLAVKHSGATAYKLLEHHGHSVMCGHTHRMGKVYKTVRDINDNPEILTAAEIGCTCLIKKGIGYAPQSDWQQGLAVVNLYPDNVFNIELATYVEGQLLFGGNTYR